ncbi:MAG: hypothetical protein ACRDMH_03390 [Solirubrobacterales bacterium]
MERDAVDAATQTRADFVARLTPLHREAIERGERAAADMLHGYLRAITKGTKLPLRRDAVRCRDRKFGRKIIAAGEELSDLVYPWDADEAGRPLGNRWAEALSRVSMVLLITFEDTPSNRHYRFEELAERAEEEGRPFESARLWRIIQLESARNTLRNRHREPERMVARARCIVAELDPKRPDTVCPSMGSSREARPGSPRQKGSRRGGSRASSDDPGGGDEPPHHPHSRLSPPPHRGRR